MHGTNLRSSPQVVIVKTETQVEISACGDSANTSGDSGAAKVVTDFSSLLPTALSEVSLPDKN